MKTFISIYLPNWSTDLLKRRSEQHEKPLILFVEQGAEKVVARCCMNARKRGAEEGLTLAHALSLAPEAEVRPYDAAHDILSLRRLGRWISRYSPLTAVDAADDIYPGTFFDGRYCGINSDISASLRLFKGSKNIIASIVQRLRERGFAVRAAAAPSLGAAWALSRYAPAPVSFVSPDSLTSRLAALPIEALRVAPAQALLFRELGITHVSHLLPIPHHQLLKRFGKETCAHLRRALALEEEIIVPLRSRTSLKVERNFEGPTCDYRALHYVIRELLNELLEPLSAKQQFVRTLTLMISRSGLPPDSRKITLHAPSNCSEHFWALIRPRIESLQMADGVTGISLGASATEHIAPALAALIAGSRSEQAQQRQIDMLIDSLESRLGAQQVLRAHPHASHLPERSFCYYPAKAKPPASPAPSGQCPRLPPLLFKKPAPLQAMSALPDSPPHHFVWNSKVFRLQCAEGPLRLMPEWWSERQSDARDYFRVQTAAGTWLWIFREAATSRWFLHGIWS